jgi:hypothetical protein
LAGAYKNRLMNILFDKFANFPALIFFYNLQHTFWELDLHYCATVGNQCSDGFDSNLIFDFSSLDSSKVEVD